MKVQIIEMEIIKEKYEKVKQHIIDHKVAYTCAATAIVTAGITFIIMRSVASQHTDRGNAVVAKDGIAVLGKKVVMDNVSYISANRQGSPAWVVRCIETGDIFTSQLSAAREMGLSAPDLSQHLNGRKGHVQGYHFERICLAG
jgi:hypothetical protein